MWDFRPLWRVWQRSASECDFAEILWEGSRVTVRTVSVELGYSRLSQTLLWESLLRESLSRPGAKPRRLA